DASPLTALLLPHIFPICSVVAPCQRGASPASVRRWTFTTDCQEHPSGYLTTRPDIQRRNRRTRRTEPVFSAGSACSALIVVAAQGVRLSPALAAQSRPQLQWPAQPSPTRRTFQPPRGGK